MLSMNIVSIVDKALESEEVTLKVIPELQKIVEQSQYKDLVTEIQSCFRCLCIGWATAQKIRNGCVTVESLIAEVRHVISNEPHRISEILMQLDLNQSVDEVVTTTIITVDNWRWRMKED